MISDELLTRHNATISISIPYVGHVDISANDLIEIDGTGLAQFICKMVNMTLEELEGFYVFNEKPECKGITSKNKKCKKIVGACMSLSDYVERLRINPESFYCELHP